MLESNPKKKSRGQGYRTELGKLPLIKLFARSKHGAPKRLTVKKFKKLVEALRKGDIAAAEKTKRFEFVDFSGKVVDGDKLMDAAKRVEDKMRRDVGLDNSRVHPPPVMKLPKWIDELLDRWSPRT
jgi:hypothetical protein